MVNRVGLAVEGVGASVHHIDRGGTPGCLYTRHSHSLSRSHTLPRLSSVHARPNQCGGHRRAHTCTKGRREILCLYTGAYNAHTYRKGGGGKYTGGAEFRGGFRPTVQRGGWRRKEGEGKRVGCRRGVAPASGGGQERREMRDSAGVGADTHGCRRFHGYHHPRCEQALHVILA